MSCDGNMANDANRCHFLALDLHGFQECSIALLCEMMRPRAAGWLSLMSLHLPAVDGFDESAVERFSQSGPSEMERQNSSSEF